MKLFIVAFLVAVATAGRLENTYLPAAVSPSYSLHTPVSTAYFYRTPVTLAGLVGGVHAPAATVTSQLIDGISTPTAATDSSSIFSASTTQSTGDIPTAAAATSSNATSTAVTTQSTGDNSSPGITSATAKPFGDISAPIAAIGSTPTAPVVPSGQFVVGGVSPPSLLYGVSLAPVQTYAVPASPPVPILRFTLDNNGRGIYRYEYETANHIAAQESGSLNSAGSSQVQGVYSYLAPSGEIISLNYVADENGFRPEGAHLPTPPPVPEAIQRSLEINSAEEARIAAEQRQSSASGAAVAATVQTVVANNQYLPPAIPVLQQGGYRY